MKNLKIAKSLSLALIVFTVAAIAGCGQSTPQEDNKTSEKSFTEYYETRFEHETLGANNEFLMKTPEELGFNELKSVKVTCPEEMDGPCGGDLLILSKEALKPGEQEFYFAQAGGAGYTYYGPFTDDLNRIIEESKTIDALKSE